GPGPGRPGPKCHPHPGRGKSSNPGGRSEGLDGAALRGRSRPVAHRTALRPRRTRGGEGDDTCHSSENPISKIEIRKSKFESRTWPGLADRSANFEFRVSSFEFLSERHCA